MGETGSRKRGRRGSPESWSVDGHVGQRLRTRRTLLGMSQEKLGEAIGLTFQQVQKYERGANRISAGTLYRLGQILGVRVDYFFDEFDDEGSTSSTIEAGGRSGEGISRREARLLRLWRSASPSVTEEILSLLGSLTPHADEEAKEEVATAPIEPPIPSPVAAPVKPAPAPRGRRRHGAVWDPADITAAVRTTSRSK